MSNHFWCSMTICHNCLHSGPHLLRSLHLYGTHYQVLFCQSWSHTLVMPAVSVVTAILAPILIQISAYPSESHPDSARNCNDSPKLTSKVFEEGSPQSCLHQDRPACPICFVKVSISILPKRMIILSLPSAPSVTSTQNSLPRGSSLILGALMGALGSSNSGSTWTI